MPASTIIASLVAFKLHLHELNRIHVEQVMLLGYASTPEEAQLIVYGGPKPEQNPEDVQLYTAPDPEDDERAQKAIEEMADALIMLQEAVAADHKDPSVLEAINASENFFKHGVQPKRGLDPIDKLMTRKRTMMDQCGNQSKHYISSRHVSPHLFCALRVHVMNVHMLPQNQLW